MRSGQSKGHKKSVINSKEFAPTNINYGMVDICSYVMIVHAERRIGCQYRRRLSINGTFPVLMRSPCISIYDTYDQDNQKGIKILNFYVESHKL